MHLYTNARVCSVTLLVHDEYVRIATVTRPAGNRVVFAELAGQNSHTRFESLSRQRFACAVWDSARWVLDVPSWCTGNRAWQHRTSGSGEERAMIL